ncbi:hypothetical protein JF66_09230 [Cryobacterium sp. MLB-32]|uniref:PucR family transcriptional regulator n=1 Tax=Cryobacterium sp. MLB-32 TaxID=1529318 RepID=UPI0004E6C871|nr:helix-turn-helix domain-containing protein [Cryobacterium sp. MLB-32]KFF59752.1 hypothetical protein JF66_09230 [Cryobacterium sp. MLB-32]
MTTHVFETPRVAVSELLTTLEGSGLRLASQQADRTVALTSPTLFDCLVPFAGRRHGVLLAIGVHPEAPDSADVVRGAAGRGFDAIVIKSLSLSVETLAAVADAAGIALLVVDDEVEWRQLESVLNSALTTAAEPPGSLTGLAVGDLFALANAIAALVGGATAIEDLQTRILAYSTLPAQPIDETRRDGILGRQVPDDPDNANAYASVYRSEGALRLPALAPGLPRMAVAIRAGTQPLGSIWVVDERGRLDDDAAQALEQAADIAALHLLRARSAADLVRQQRTVLLRRLLDDGEDARLVAGQLELDTTGPYAVVAFHPQLGASGEELGLSRLFDLISMQCEAYQHGAECAVIGATIYALFSGPSASDLTGLHGTAQRIVERAEGGLRASVRAAIGSRMAQVTQISRSRRDADLVLLLQTTHTPTSVVASAHDLRSRLTLLELAQVFRDTPRFMAPQAERMLESDARSGTDYAKTVRTYLDCSRDSAVTAARLSVHQNTLRYRLKRTHDLFAVDLENADDTLALWLSLRVAEFD